jgi:hypothetical protein
MNTEEDSIFSNPAFSGPDREKLTEARRKAAAHLERLRYLEDRIQTGSATPEEEEEFEDKTWWENHPMPALPPPDGTPNPWELPRPPKRQGSSGET